MTVEAFGDYHVPRVQAWLDGLDRDARRRWQKRLAKQSRRPEGLRPEIVIALIALSRNVSAARAWDVLRTDMADGHTTVVGSRSPDGPREIIPSALFRGRPQ